MKAIIDLLKMSICNSPIVRNSSVGVCTKWKRAQFITLSEIIAETLSNSEHLQGKKRNELGTTISSITLQRIFNDDYSAKENPDLRFLKTLDKLAIFLGYSSLNNFLKNQPKSLLIEELKPKETTSIDNEKNDDVFRKLIYNYCFEQFQSILKLPYIDLKGLSKYIFDDGPLKRRIYDLLIRYSNLKFSVNNEGNRSNFEVYDFKINTIDSDLVVAQVYEFWNIEWKDEKNKVAKNYNNINKQTYFIKKRNGVWKIWDNHNPDYNNLIKEVEESFQKIM